MSNFPERILAIIALILIGLVMVGMVAMFATAVGIDIRFWR